MEPSLSRGDRYERTYELRSAAGEDVHGEANLDVVSFDRFDAKIKGLGVSRREPR